MPLLEWAFVMLLLEEQVVPLLEWAFVMLLPEEQVVPLLEWAFVMLLWRSMQGATEKVGFGGVGGRMAHVEPGKRDKVDCHVCLVE